MQIPENMIPFAAELLEQWREQERREKIARYKHLNKMARKGQILFCGSSLMEQFPIQELLTDVDLPLAVYNRGVGGYTTEELTRMLDVLVLDLEPSHIFINIGTNDLNDEDYRVEDLIGRYDYILTRIRQTLPEAKLYVLAYYPCNRQAQMADPIIADRFRFRTNERVREANEAVQRLAGAHGAMFLDLNTGITDEDGNLKKEYTIEGIHMYGDGYMQVLQQLLPVLKGLKENG